MVFETDATGPQGDKRRLEITVEGDTITVLNLLAGEGDRLQVLRPVYGYEKHMAEEIARLQSLTYKGEAL